MLNILGDAERRPELYCWFGSIPALEIQEWLQRCKVSLPPDLVEFWCATGGGDIFETETILRPPVPSIPRSNFCEDNTDTQNSWHWSRGMPEGLFVFQTGGFLSAVALESQRYVTLRDNYSIEREFACLDD